MALAGLLSAAGTLSGVVFAKKSFRTGTAREISWGPITSYADATNLDSPLRQIRNSKYDTNPSENPSHQVLTEDSGHFRELPMADGPVADALPIQESGTIVVGTITEGHAHLSNDRTSIYSEFQFHVGQVLRTLQNLPLHVDDTIDVERMGGTIRFPSGKVIERGDWRTMPVTGGRYVLFLRHEEVGQDYSIITGYRLAGTHVYWLDGASEKRCRAPILAEVKDANETKFLKQVTNLVIEDRPAPGFRAADRLPADLEARLQMGLVLDSAWRARLYRLPDYLYADLPMRPPRCEYYVIGGHVVLVDVDADWRVADVVKVVLRH